MIKEILSAWLVPKGTVLYNKNQAGLFVQLQTQRSTHRISYAYLCRKKQEIDNFLCVIKLHQVINSYLIGVTDVSNSEKRNSFANNALKFLMNCFVRFMNTYSHINVETVVQLKLLQHMITYQGPRQTFETLGAKLSLMIRGLQNSCVLYDLPFNLWVLWVLYHSLHPQ